MVDDKEIIDLIFMFCDQVASKVTYIFICQIIIFNSMGLIATLFYNGLTADV